MAQSLNDPKTPKNASKAGIGHNQLSPEEVEALYLSHLTACRDQDASLAKAMEVVKAVRKVRNQVRNTAKAEGFPLKIMDEVLKAEGRTRGDLQAEQDMRRNMWNWAGLPVGGQGDLFVNMPLEIKDAIQVEADGYNAGIRGLDNVPPAEVAPRFHQDWLKGWMAGQERNAWALSERGKIVDRRTDISPQRVTLEPEPEAQNDNEAASLDAVA